MKLILIGLLAIAVLSGCQSLSRGSRRISRADWNDMWSDMALRHQYEKELAAADRHSQHQRAAYASARHQAVAKAPEQSPRPDTADQKAQEALDDVRDLSNDVAVLKQALIINAATKNDNEGKLLALIKALDTKILELQNKSRTAPPSPSPSAEVSPTTNN
jgi:hypothetical protein